MLSRGASNASHQPKRAKSASSIKYRVAVYNDLHLVEPETVHEHALTAAKLAYERRNEGEAEKTGVTKRNGVHCEIKTVEERQQLGRRQSVRFAGPSAVPTRTRSITRREAPDNRTSHESHRHSLPSQYGPVDSSLIFNEGSDVVLPEEFGETYIASQPSSYRKLRKAKSMFSPGNTPSAIFSDGTPNSKRHFQRHSLQTSDGTGEPIRLPDPRLRRSFSFLRGVTDRISTGNRQYATHDAAIQLARDTYLRQLEQQRLKEQPSFFHRSKRQKAQKAFRRTVRTSSTNSYGTAISSPLSFVEVGKPQGLASKARTLSQAWKEKIKRVLKRSSNDEGTIPAQHLDASHTHYGNQTSNSQDSGQHYPSIPEPNAELLQRVSSRESSLHREPLFVSKSPHPGSVRSVSSDGEESNDKSRVTSWTNSTAANTINMPLMMDRKRLSIIREDGGPHQSSSSAQQYADSGDGYSSFRQPLIQNGTGRVETQRIFSALQREIDENNRKAILDDSESGTDSGSDQQTMHPSVLTPRGRRSIRPSVRRIKTTPDTTARHRGMQLSNSVVFDSTAASNDDGSFRQAIVEDIRGRYQQDNAGLRESLTPQEIAEFNEPNLSVWKGPLREVKSAFFPPSMRIERSNTSPFRRVMLTTSEEDDSTQIGSQFSNQQQHITRINPFSSRIRNGSVTGSESIYSRSSGGHTPKAAFSSLSLAGTESCGEAGTAVIITSQASTQEPPARPFFPQRYSSTNSSGDWKKFMASQVASLETSSARHDQIIDALSGKESGHKREDAQLDGDDVKIGRVQVLEGVPNQPLGMIQGNAKARPRPMAARSRLMNNGPHTKASFNVQNENAPVSLSSASPLNSSHEEKEKESQGLTSSLHERNSQVSLTSQNNSKRPTTADIPRSSPERAERLRRLKSSSITTLRKMPSRGENPASFEKSDSSGQQEHDTQDSDTSLTVVQSEAGMNHKLVNNFLKDRRREMSISEESEIGPAFL